MNEVLEKINRWVDDHKDEMLADIAKIVAVPSRMGEAVEGKPFGTEPARALDTALEMCRKYGFATKNYDYYVGAVDMNDKAPMLDILAHLDVVPEGTGWDSDPYTVVEKNGYIYGRGVADDKGPAITAIYAMRAVKELGLPLSTNVRLILGTNEENGSHDLPYYFEREKSAPHSFTPDASFPVYNTEKGRCRPHFNCDFGTETALPRLVKMKGGETINIVPERACATVLGLSADEIRAAAEAEAKRCGVVELKLADVDGGCTLDVKGVPAHGSTPDKGINATTALISILTKLPLADTASTRMLAGLNTILPHGDSAGEALGMAMSDEASGPLTMSLDVFSLEDGKLMGACDCRTPVCATEANTKDVVIEKMKAIGLSGHVDVIPPHHVPESEPFIQNLLTAFEAVSGQKGECMATGGGTYVHKIEGGVAFGPNMPSTQTDIHGANEKITIDDLVMGCKMYAMVIAETCR